MRRAAIVLAAVWLSACSVTPNGDSMAPRTVDHVDLKRYQGTWYELARMPMFFQRNCAQSEAHYRLKGDGNVAVTNRCLTFAGKWEEANGTASPQVEGKTDKLWVVFDNWFSRLLPGVAKGNYWVLYVSDDYKLAIVGNPSRQYLWLLSRTAHVSESVRNDLLMKAQQQGYDTTKLIWRAEDAKVAKVAD
ncbi:MULTISPECIES: lipocalin family protein [unclassified Pseudomonas]|uniref:lipocalin family protein n=1 Tax=unclassified Pseudomonas TaxID=196821 RepID=UPI000D36A98F|nr:MULTISPECIES: lipocalin family protein [unclassified Pseudomonas]RAU46524.1 lipocalin [Pseudomonas sp. RIT 409]RAU52463.1 lipocalin [Pseudomonas sp. RIT 412]